jgi:hypothetical protein
MITSYGRKTARRRDGGSKTSDSCSLGRQKIAADQVAKFAEKGRPDGNLPPSGREAQPFLLRAASLACFFRSLNRVWLVLFR